MIALEAIEFFFIGLMRSFDLSIEARGPRGDEAMSGPEALTGSTEGVKFHGAIEGGFRTGGIPVGEDGIVVRLNDAGGEGKGSQDILGERFGDMDRHFFAELDESEAGAAIDGRILIEASTFDQIGDEFDVDLEQIAWTRDDEATAVAFGFGFTSTAEALAFNDFSEGRSRGKVFEAMVLEELKETQGAEAGFSSQFKDTSAEASFHRSRRVIRTAGMIQQSRAVLMSLLKAFLPFVEGFSGDTEALTSERYIV